MSLKLGQTATVDYAKIHWFHKLNSRVDSFGDPLVDIDAKYERINGKVVAVERPKGKGAPTAEAWKGSLVQTLAGGWNNQQGNVTVEEITKADVAKAIAERKEQIAAWKKQGLHQLAITAEGVWFPKGKAVEPEYVANDHYRRGYSVMAAIMRRLEEGLGAEYPILCTLTVFVDEKERIIAHAQENDKETGRSMYSWKDKLQTAYRLNRVGGSEADLVRALGAGSRGTAQQLMRLVFVNAKAPEVHLYERCLLPTPDADKTTGKIAYVKDGYVNGPSLGKEELKKLLKGEAIGKDAPTFQPDPAGVEAFVKHLMTGKKNAQPIDKAAIDTWAETSDCTIVKLVAAAVKVKDGPAKKRLDKLLLDESLVKSLNDFCDKHDIK